jgi:hypothetical protein
LTFFAFGPWLLNTLLRARLLAAPEQKIGSGCEPRDRALADVVAAGKAALGLGGRDGLLREITLFSACMAKPTPGTASSSISSDAGCGFSIILARRAGRRVYGYAF